MVYARVHVSFEASADCLQEVAQEGGELTDQKAREKRDSVPAFGASDAVRAAVLQFILSCIISVVSFCMSLYTCTKFPYLTLLRLP